MTDSPTTASKRTRLLEVVFTTLLLVTAGAMTWMAAGFGSQAAALPLLVGVPLTVMLAVQLVISIRTHWQASDPVLQRNEPRDAETEFEGMSLGAVFASVVALVALFVTVGSLWTCLIFTAGFIRFVGRQSVVLSVGIGLIVTVITVLFTEFFGIRVHEGWAIASGYLPEMSVLWGWSGRS